MFNDMMELLSDVPLTLAAAWAVWFGAGALLAVWYRKAQANLEMQPRRGHPDGGPREVGSAPA